MEVVRLRAKDVKLFGHNDVATTMIYTHVFNKGV